MLEDNIVYFCHARDYNPQVLSQIEVHRADKVTYVFNYQETGIFKISFGAFSTGFASIWHSFSVFTGIVGTPSFMKREASISAISSLKITAILYLSFICLIVSYAKGFNV